MQFRTIRRQEGGRRIRGDIRTEHPLVSIIMVVFRAREELQNLLDNVFGLATSGFELIIVDGLPSNPMATPLGTQYPVTIDTPIVTTVANAAVYAGHDSYGLFFERGESDVSEDRVINVVGNAAGNIWVDNFEMFQGSGGCLVDTSLSPVSLYVSGATQFYGCGLVLGGADVTRASAIYWTDQSNSRSANLQVIGAPFFRYTPGAIYGGNIHVSGLNNVLLDDIQCYDCERNQEAHFLFAQNSNYITVSNSLISNSHTVTSWNSSSAQIQFGLTTGAQPIVAFSNLNFFNSTEQVLAQAISAGFPLNNPPLTATGIHANESGYASLYSPTVSESGVTVTRGDSSLKSVGRSNTTWTSGSTVPSGGCQSGSLYTNTAGAANSKLYVCIAGVWKAALTQ